MGFEVSEITDNDGAGGGKALSSTNVSCSICLEPVTFDDERSCVKLICGHEFHLDCIGSAFNSRGAMQCPNCRNTEKGQWLYGSGGPATDDPHDEEFYDLGYSETSFGVRWCPFMFSALSSSTYEDGEFPSSAYQDLLGHQALYAEHASHSSTNQPSPYFSYYGPNHSSSPNTGSSVSDNSFWNGLSGLSEAPTSYSLQSFDPYFQSWEHNSSAVPPISNRLGNADQSSIPSITQRLARANAGVARSRILGRPFLAGHGSSARTSNSIASSAMIPPFPGGGARTPHEQLQSLQAHFQLGSGTPPGRPPLLSAARHSGSHRSSTPLASSSEQSAGYYIFSNAPNRNFSEGENQMPRSFHGWERERLASLFPSLIQAEGEPGWGIFPSANSSFQQRHGSDRTPSQGRS